MIIADALASDESALIFPCRRLRSRRTAERLPSASDRLPPDLSWTLITIPKKFTSAVGMLSYMRFSPCSRLTPTFKPSQSLVNSPCTGSGISFATILSASFTGRPDLTLRTITSMALANSLVNFFWRRFVRNWIAHRGRPKPNPNPAIRATSSDCRVMTQTNAVKTATTPQIIQNVRGDS